MTTGKLSTQSPSLKGSWPEQHVGCSVYWGQHPFSDLHFFEPFSHPHLYHQRPVSKKAIYGLREAPRQWQQERDQQLRELQFVYNDRSAHLVQSYIHPSLWFIVEGPRDSTMGIPPFDNRLRSDEWTAKLHNHKILGYVGVYQISFEPGFGAYQGLAQKIKVPFCTIFCSFLQF